jgi:hypothetical protein
MSSLAFSIIKTLAPLSHAAIPAQSAVSKEQQ